MTLKDKLENTMKRTRQTAADSDYDNLRLNAIADAAEAAYFACTEPHSENLEFTSATGDMFG
jgi:hypothetical protein